MGERSYYKRYKDSGEYSEERMNKFREHRQKNRMLFGLAIALVGTGLLLRTMGLLPYFSLQFSWPYIVILVGIVSGIKHNFRNNAWWILVLVGIANLIPQFMIMGQPSKHYVWPAFIIIGGLAIAFKPRRDKYCSPHKITANITSESTLNIEATFGGRKEVVTSKDFKGGIVSLTFAGCELNLSQADFVEPSVILDCRVSFGGLEIIVPSHWDIQNEVNPSFGNVEDSRTIQTATTNETKKLLILRGSCSFGSIELKSF
jgi:hypothetical protein